MADPQFVRVEPGQVIEAVGIRPTTRGLLLATSVSPSSIVGTSFASRHLLDSRYLVDRWHVINRRNFKGSADLDCRHVIDCWGLIDRRDLN